MDEYNKLDLSHVISRGQKADDLTLQSVPSSPSSTLCVCFHTPGMISTPKNRLVKSHDNQWRYDKLVLPLPARRRLSRRCQRF